MTRSQAKNDRKLAALIEENRKKEFETESSITCRKQG